MSGLENSDVPYDPKQAMYKEQIGAIIKLNKVNELFDALISKLKIKVTHDECKTNNGEYKSTMKSTNSFVEILSEGLNTKKKKAKRNISNKTKRSF